MKYDIHMSERKYKGVGSRSYPGSNFYFLSLEWWCWQDEYFSALHQRREAGKGNSEDEEMESEEEEEVAGRLIMRRRRRRR